jgi:SAM-dependent methyltransferase
LEYWERRYSSGKTSGRGSYGELAEFKAEILNDFVEKNGIHSVIEFGCGDGNQLSLARYPAYVGLDVSKTVIQICEDRFKDNDAFTFLLYDPYSSAELANLKADLSLSLDVIYHLVDDELYDLHMAHLFGAAERNVIIYSSNTNDNPPSLGPHVKHRRFSDWIDARTQQWRLAEEIPNKYPYDPADDTGSLADFFIYEKK